MQLHAKVSVSEVGNTQAVAMRMQVLAEEMSRLAEIMAISDTDSLPPQSHVEIARRIYEFRRAREKYIPHIFGEPAWDILLELFIRRCENRRVSVKFVQIASNVPATTSLRWIKALEDEGLIEKDRAAFDSRVRLVKLSDRGFSLMKSILSANARAELHRSSQSGSQRSTEAGPDVGL
jgi:DNA-binding MarR family transcriptional regulator